MDEQIITAVVALATGILGSEVVKRFLTSGQDREATAQGAIIELAREALVGWREERGAVIKATEMLREHDKSVGLYYQDLGQRMNEQDERLERIDDRLKILLTKPGVKISEKRA